jgi:hypothetical protein
MRLNMNWQEIRQHYPQQWLLVEATKARSEAGQRIVEQLAVVATFPDSVTALRSYQHCHHEAPNREMYVLHTSRSTLNIRERRWSGIRAAQ